MRRFVQVFGSPRLFYPALLMIIIAMFNGWLSGSALIIALCAIAFLGVCSAVIGK